MTTQSKTIVSLGNKGSRREREVELHHLEIPDLWHIGQAERDPRCKKAILDCWHLAHDLKNALIAALENQP